MKDEKASKKKKENVKKIGKKLSHAKVDPWVKRYQKENPVEPGSGGAYGWLYGCDVIEEMLKYKGCEGIWFFKGIKDVDGKEKECLVLYPADKDGNILNTSIQSLGAAAAKQLEFEPVDDGDECPPGCPNGLG